MDGPRQELLADARLAVDQHGGVEVDDGPGQLEHLPHALTLGHDPVEAELLLVPPDARALGAAQLLQLDGVPDDEDGLGEVEGLEQIVDGAQAERLHRGLDRGVGRHHDHRDVGMTALDLPHHLDAVHLGQALVGDDEVEVLVAQPLQRGLAAGDRADLVALGLKRPLQRTHEDRVVLDDQDPMPHRASLGWLLPVPCRVGSTAGVPWILCREPEPRQAPPRPIGRRRPTPRAPTPDSCRRNGDRCVWAGFPRSEAGMAGA